jgi:3-oxoacyl-[acyl-carrier protein] reductase
MELGLEGKVAIVTGGSKGIGRATVLGLLDEGASVVACARGKAALDETVALAGESYGRHLLPIQADLMNAEEIKKVVATAAARFKRIDILVNNAGSARPGEFQKITDAEWLEDWQLKFFGYVRMAREAMPHLERNKAGVIVNVIGTGGLAPSAGYMVGGAANAALNHFTMALADEGSKRGVRVVGINPGPILTERLMLFTQRRAGAGDINEVLKKMTPIGRPGKPEEVADLIMFLASERAAFIYGANVTIDGGAILSRR